MSINCKDDASTKDGQRGVELGSLPSPYTFTLPVKFRNHYQIVLSKVGIWLQECAALVPKCVARKSAF